MGFLVKSLCLGVFSALNVVLAWCPSTFYILSWPLLWVSLVKILTNFPEGALALEGRKIGARKGIPKNLSSQVWAKFAWTFLGEFLLNPSFSPLIKGPIRSENSWEGFGWFFAIERLLQSPKKRHIRKITWNFWKPPWTARCPRTPGHPR